MRCSRVAFSLLLAVAVGAVIALGVADGRKAEAADAGAEQPPQMESSQGADQQLARRPRRGRCHQMYYGSQAKCARPRTEPRSDTDVDTRQDADVAEHDADASDFADDYGSDHDDEQGAGLEYAAEEAQIQDYNDYESEYLGDPEHAYRATYSEDPDQDEHAHDYYEYEPEYEYEYGEEIETDSEESYEEDSSYEYDDQYDYEYGEEVETNVEDGYDEGYSYEYDEYDSEYGEGYEDAYTDTEDTHEKDYSYKYEDEYGYEHGEDGEMDAEGAYDEDYSYEDEYGYEHGENGEMDTEDAYDEDYSYEYDEYTDEYDYQYGEDGEMDAEDAYDEDYSYEYDEYADEYDYQYGEDAYDDDYSYEYDEDEDDYEYGETDEMDAGDAYDEDYSYEDDEYDGEYSEDYDPYSEECYQYGDDPETDTGAAADEDYSYEYERYGDDTYEEDYSYEFDQADAYEYEPASEFDSEYDVEWTGQPAMDWQERIELSAWLPGELLMATDRQLLQTLEQTAEELPEVRRTLWLEHLNRLGFEALELASEFQMASEIVVLELADDPPGAAALLGVFRLVERGELETDEAIDLLRRSLQNLPQQWLDGINEITSQQTEPFDLTTADRTAMGVFAGWASRSADDIRVTIRSLARQIPGL